MMCERIQDCLLEGALFDDNTVWPLGFDPLEYGAIKVGDKHS